MATKTVLVTTGIFPPDIGGPATYSKLLLDNLPQKGFEVRILAYGNASQKQNGKVFIVSKKLPRGLKHFIYFVKVIWLGRKADIIFAQDPVSVGLPAMLAAKILGKKFIIKIVGDYAWEQAFQRYNVKDLLDDFLSKKYGFAVEFLRSLEIFCTKNADCVIVPSEYLGELVKKWGIKPEKIKVIYNAVDIPQIDLSKEEARRELGLDADYKIILSVGRNVPWKGFEKLSIVKNELEKEIPGIKLATVIYGTEKKMPREAIFKALKAADVFVLNTGYEGLSHQILEAMAIGVPVVTTNIGGNPELIKDGQNGLLVEYNNKNQLKEAIKKVLLNEVDVAGFVKKSRDFVQNFTEERMVLELISVFNSI